MMNKKIIKISKKQIIFLLAVVIAIVVTLIMLLCLDKVKTDDNYKSEYITEESLIEMSTVAEGETIITYNEFGDKIIIDSNGSYKLSDFADATEKLSNQKVVPLIGKWTSRTNPLIYEFFEDSTFKISVPYQSESGSIKYIFYEGIVEIVPDVTLGFTKIGENTLEGTLAYVGIDSNTYVQKNLYYLKLYYTTIKNSENSTVYTVTEDELNNVLDDLDSYFEGFAYTYWDEDNNIYSIKMCHFGTKTTEAYTRQDV